MFSDHVGPIEHFSWGKFIICGDEHSGSGDERIGKGKDIRLIGKKVTRWKERKGHILSKAMITGIYDEMIETLIIGNGVEGLVRCPGDVLVSIKNHGIKDIIIEKTPDACRIYNELFRNGKRIALLAHGTC